MESLYELCSSNGINIIEDAAHALGSVYPSGEKIGSCKFSDLTVFSFHPVKNITTGEGGIITTNNKELYETLLKLRSHGISKDISNFKNKKLSFTAGVPNPWYYEMSILGFHYRITDMQATLGFSQMKKLKKFLMKRHQLAKRYDKAFANNQFFQPIQLNLRNYSAKHLYPIKINFSKISLSKNEIMKKLRDKGIITQVHYLPIPLHEYYQKLGYDIKNLPNTAKFYNEVLSIPLFPNLGRIRQRRIIKAIDSLIRS
jgi:dTDP-4-amino-4,6-dideoxygalactose transaminase